MGRVLSEKVPTGFERGCTIPHESLNFGEAAVCRDLRPQDSRLDSTEEVIDEGSVKTVIQVGCHFLPRCVLVLATLLATPLEGIGDFGNPKWSGLVRQILWTRNSRATTARGVGAQLMLVLGDLIETIRQFCAK